MGTYSLTDKNGRVINVDGPEGLSKREVIRLAKRQQARAIDRARDAEEVTPGERFSDAFSGLGRGAVNSLEQMALGLATGLGEENELKARDFIQSAAKSLRPDTEPGLEGSIQSALTEGLGSLGPYLATGLAGPVAGPLLAGGMGVSAGIGDASERARAAGATQEERNLSLLGGGVSGATQAVPIANMFRLANKLPKGVKTRATNALKSGSTEGAQEAIYEFLQNLNEREVYNPELESLYKNVAEAGGLGVGVGAIAQILVDFLPGRKWGGGRPPKDDSTGDTTGGAPTEDALAPTEFSPQEETLAPTEFSPQDEALEIAKFSPIGLGAVSQRPTPMDGPMPMDDIDSLLDRLAALDTYTPPERSKKKPQMIMPQLPVNEGALDEAIKQLENIREPTGQLALPRPSERDMEINENVNRKVEEARARDKERREAMPPNLLSSQESFVVDNMTDEQVDRELRKLIDDPWEIFPAEALEAKAKAPKERTTSLPINKEMQGELDVTTPQQSAPVQGDFISQPQGPARTGPPRPATLTNAGKIPDSKRKVYTRPQDQLGPKPKDKTAPAEPSVIEKAIAMNSAQQPKARPLPMDYLKAVLGVQENSPVPAVARRLAGKDLNDPASADDIRFQLTEYVNNDENQVSDIVKGRVDSFLKRLTQLSDENQTVTDPVTGISRQKNTINTREFERNEQADPLFEPKSPQTRLLNLDAEGQPVPSKAAAKAGVQTSAESTDDTSSKPKSRAKGTGAKGSSKSNRTGRASPKSKKSTGTAGATGRSGVADTGDTVPNDRGRKGTQSDSLKGKPKAKAKADPKKADPKKKVDENDKVTSLLADRKVQTSEQRKRKGQGYTPAEAAKTYFSKHDQDTAIYRIVYDAERGYSDNQTAAQIKQERVGQIRDELKGTSRQVGIKALEWLKANANEAQLASLKEAKEKLKKLDDLNKKQKEASEAYDEAIAYQQQAAEALRQKETEEEAKEREANRKAKKREQQILDEFNAEVDAVGEASGAIKDAEREALADLGLTNDGLTLLEEEGALPLAKPADPSVTMLLREGEVKAALELMSEREGGDIARIAKLFAGRVGDLKFEFAADLGDVDGRLIRGVYKPSQNTVYLLDSEVISNHKILHEIAHALTHKQLNNKSSAITKNVNRIFTEAKSRFPDRYATSSIHEFVAEYFGNSDFRRELALMFPKQGKKSFLQRITDAIRNFLGLGNTRSLVLNEMMERVLAPSAASPSSEMYYLLGDPQAMSDKVFDMPRGVANAKNAISFAKIKAIIGALGSLQLSLVVDAAKPYFKSAVPMQRVISEYEGRLYNGQQEIGLGAAKELEQWMNDNPDANDAIRKILLEGTVFEIDFRKTRNEYTGKQREAYEKLEPVWDSLKDNGGQRVYRTIRSNYDRMYEELLDQLQITLKGVDPVTGQEIFNNLAEMYRKQALQGYFPLRRSGEYLLEYTFTENGKAKTNFEMYERKADRDRRVAELKEVLDPEQFDLIRTPTKVSEFFNQRDGSVPVPFLKKTIGLINQLNLSNEADGGESIREELLRAAIEVAPQRNILSQMGKRKGEVGERIGGYDSDVNKVYQSSLNELSRKIISLEMRDRLSQVQAELDEEIKTIAAKPNSERNEMVIAVGDELLKRISLARNPVSGIMTTASNYAKATAYAYTLGLNVSSALIDTVALPMVILPHLNAKYPNKSTFEVMSEINKALKTVMGTPMKTTIESYSTKGLTDQELENLGLGDRQIREKGAWFSVANIDFTQKGLSREIKQLEPLVELMRKQGQIHQFAGTLFSGESIGAESKWLAVANNWMGFMMQGSERVRRETTIIANYRMELERQKKAGEKIDYEAAAQIAIDNSQLINGAMSTLSNTRYGQLPIPSMALMYKSYGTRMLYLQFRMAQQALAGETPEARKVALNQLFQVVTASALFAGVRGIPMMGVVAFLYNMFWADDDEDDFDTMLRKNIGTGFTTGALNYTLGVNFADRIALTDLLYRSNRNYEQTSAELAMTAIFGPVWGTAQRAGRAASYFGKGDYQKGFENVLPPVVSNPMKALRYGTDGARTSRGDLITDDFGPTSLIGQALGFAAEEVTEAQRFVSNQKRIERKRQEKRNNILNRAYLAYRFGDYEGYVNEMQNARDFNSSLEPTSNFIIDFGKDGTFARSFRARRAASLKRVKGALFRDEETARFAEMMFD